MKEIIYAINMYCFTTEFVMLLLLSVIEKLKRVYKILIYFMKNKATNFCFNPRDSDSTEFLIFLR